MQSIYILEMLMLKYIVPAVASALFALTAPMAHAAPAVSISGTACGLLDGNGAVAVTTDTKTLATQSANNNGMLKCQASVPASTTGTAVRYDFASTGLLCFGGNPVNQSTDQWHETVSADGNATLTCLFSTK
jgi:hypothetical protein